MAGESGLRRGRVTIRNVAEDAGVSVAAVSKVIRNAYGVSDALRRNVIASIERLGYRPSMAARGMRGQTYTIGLLLVGIGNPFLPEVIEGCNEVLAAAEYKTMIGVGHAELALETALIESMIDFRMDGLILIAPRIAGNLLEEYARQIPLVAVGHHEESAGGFDTVNSNDRLGAKMAVDDLISSGYRDVGMISLPARNGTDFDVYRKREEGYREALAEAGLGNRARVFRCREEAEFMLQDVNAFLDDLNRPAAVFCWSDLHAIPLLNAARSRGLSTPEDLAVVGYDNSPVGRLPIVGLTSVDQLPGRLGGLAAETLLDRIGGRTVAKHSLIDPKLVRRTSY